MTPQLINEMAVECLHGDCYDILDRFTEEDVAQCIESIFTSLQIARLHGSVQQQNVCAVLKHRNNKGTRYKIKVSNCKSGSFISVSSDSYTGMSRSLYLAYDFEDSDTEYQVSNLCEMLNEAWYNCTQYCHNVGW